MTLNEARKILGLAPEEDSLPHLEEFKVAREHIAAMVRSAPNEVLADRYQKGLIEFDQALAAIREHHEAAGGGTMPSSFSRDEQSIPPPAKTVVLGVALGSPKVASAEVPDGEPVMVESGGRWLSYLAWFVVFLVGAMGGAWIYLKSEQAKNDQRLIRIAFLERQGSIFIENRRWQEAAGAFTEIESISPRSEISARGRRSIEAGMGEEQTQFIGYWTGQSTAELEAGRLDEAESAARQVLDKYPNEKDAADLMGKIAIARIGQSRAAALAGARQAMDQRQWSAAITTARQILATAPDDAEAKTILAEATAAQEKAAANQAKALDLLRLAAARDSGEFDQQALDWLREASSLAPDNAEIASRLEKLSSYTRTLHVPGDFATPQEALDHAHERDRIVLGAATWKGPLVIGTAVELQGGGFAETKIECAPDEGCAITIGPEAKGARISGITFRHESFAVGSERFSAALVRGGQATFVDCRFTDASGHGLAVIDGGQATVSRSRFADNGWNGVAAIGKGSTLEVRDCESLNNFEHGIESWDGAAAILVNNRCEGNSRNGIHADNGTASATIEGNQLVSNREFGFVLDSAGSGKVTGNTARANLLGGFVIRSAAGKLPVTSNQATLNQGPGLILEKGLLPTAYATNSASQNTGEQVLAGTDLSQSPEVPAASSSGTVPAPPAAAPKIPRAAIVPEPLPVRGR
ncbi:MAG: right-handed parallel beta-helix repeat-containing protein [Verrucomicrobiota bacterium]